MFTAVALYKYAIYKVKSCLLFGFKCYCGCQWHFFMPIGTSLPSGRACLVVKSPQEFYLAEKKTVILVYFHSLETYVVQEQLFNHFCSLEEKKFVGSNTFLNHLLSF